MLVVPHAPGSNAFLRFGRALAIAVRQPIRFLRALCVPDFARFSQVLLYMRSLEGTLKLVRSRGLFRGGGRLQTRLVDGAPPTAFIPEATDVARRFAEAVDGVPMSLVSEVALGIPSTAHILGGACMGASSEDGVIDARHEVHGYPDLFVVDGAAVSANPGVNPSLTITALAERAMSLLPEKAALSPK
jgi:cholesterol oxidase